MAWITMPGVVGKVYVPSPSHHGLKKHPCPNCFACQWCDETRCRVCRPSMVKPGDCGSCEPGVTSSAQGSSSTQDKS